MTLWTDFWKRIDAYYESKFLSIFIDKFVPKLISFLDIFVYDFQD